MSVAKLHPYRENGRVIFRGDIGLSGGLSKFFPYRLAGKVFLRGKRADGKILHGYVYRDQGRVFGRTAFQGICTTPPATDLTGSTLTITFNTAAGERRKKLRVRTGGAGCSGGSYQGYEWYTGVDGFTGTVTANWVGYSGGVWQWSWSVTNTVGTTGSWPADLFYISPLTVSSTYGRSVYLSLDGSGNWRWSYSTFTWNTFAACTKAYDMEIQNNVGYVCENANYAYGYNSPSDLASGIGNGNIYDIWGIDFDLDIHVVANF